MIYKQKFQLLGTDGQIRIVQEALDRIFFPWERLNAPNGLFKIGWNNLNRGHLFAHQGKLHVGNHPESDKNTDKIIRQLEGREYIFGVMYPETGDMYIDNLLEFYPHYAHETVSAEIGHTVDFHLPFTDEMRHQLYLLAHNGLADNHTYWEVSDYGREYYDLIGESMMGGFTYAYSDMDFDMSPFTHKFTKAMAPQIRAIIGIERTDYVPPVPAVLPEPPAEPIEIPVPEIQPEPVYVKVFGSSKVYHAATHYPKKTGKVHAKDRLEGFRPCKKCKP